MDGTQKIGNAGDLRCSASSCQNLIYFWKLHKFSELVESQATFQTGYLPFVERAGNVKWRLQLYSAAEGEASECTVKCYIICLNAMKVSIGGKYHVSFRNTEDEVLARLEKENWVNFNPGYSADLLDIPAQTLLRGLKDDVVIIAADITYTKSAAKNRDQTYFTGEPSPYAVLAEHFRNLPQRMAADTVIAATGAEIPVHRAVLSTRSRVFASMLSSETATGRLDIGGFEADIVMSMLSFMYTGMVDELNVPLALGLMMIGDRYEIESLIIYCSNFVSTHLDKSNVLGVLHYTWKIRKCHEIRVRAIDYLSGNLSADELKTKFIPLKDAPEIVFEIFFRKMLSLSPRVKARTAIVPHPASFCK